MSRHKMTVADRVRAYKSSIPVFTFIDYNKLADKFRVARSYIKRLCEEKFDCIKLDRKWSMRMRKDLLRGERIGTMVFLQFVKKDYADIIMAYGKGKVLRIDAHMMLETGWRDYYGVEGADYE